MKEHTEASPSSTRTISETPEATIKRLKQQVDVYPVTKHGVADLEDHAKDILLKKSKSGIKTHREEFIEFAVRLSQDKKTNYKGSEELRQSNPKKATIKAADLFGAKDLQLYKLALQEEMESQHYREAVFNESTKFIAGSKWEKPPVIIIAGPSSCGKTTATNAMIQEISQRPKDEHDKSGNLITSVDNGISREVSQIRKLAIRVANMKGYSGIADLHKQSEALDPIKKIVRSAALADNKFGLAIPETYSYWINRFGDERKFLTEMIGSDKRRLIFSRVVGANDDTFQSVVYEMGTNRAWKRSGFEEVSLDLNSRENLPESKAYGAG